jgi:hypothetical protein
VTLPVQARLPFKAKGVEWNPNGVEVYWLSRELGALADLDSPRVTMRQLFYRLVGRYGYPKTANSSRAPSRSRSARRRPAVTQPQTGPQAIHPRSVRT